MTKTALLVVDLVYDFAHPDGLVYYPQNEEILPRVKRLIDKCRESGALIVFVVDSHRAGKYDKELTMVRKHCISGTGGDEIMPILGYNEETDFKIVKRRYSSFYGTDLDLVLREHGIENTIICGTKTNCCIRATVQDAYHLNYNVIVARECVATNSDEVNEVHLTDIDKYFGRVLTLDEIFRRLDGGEL
jgi:nicotinamidase-related amidase